MTSKTPPSEYLVISRGQWDKDLPAQTIQAAIDRFYVWHGRLVEEGRARSGQRLAREGRLVSRDRVIDGPFAEAKEVVGGYWFILAASLAEATELARENPCLACGLSFEVRPIEPARASAFVAATETPSDDETRDVPRSFRSPADICASLTYDDAPAAIDWLCRAFGFVKRFVVPGPGNRIEHSELSLGTGVIMIGSSKPDDHRFSPKALAGVSQALSVFVEDPDAHFKAAMAAGARVVRELRTEEYGARGYMALDPEGHLWYFGNYRPGGYWEAPSAHHS